MKKERNNIMKKAKKLIEKLMGINPKEETLAIIFKPLDGIEEKVKIRKQIIEDKILQLKDDKENIDDQIKAYGIEVDRCNMYLDNVNKFT